MINKPTSSHRYTHKTTKNAIIPFSLLALGLTQTAFAELMLEGAEDWKYGVNGHIPVFALISDNDGSEETAFRITTGFNPATLQFNVYAPTQNGYQVSGHVQLNSHLAGVNGVQNSGFGAVNSGRESGVESRVAEIAVTADFGTVNIGKGFGIFGVPAIGDAGSGMGVGLFSPNSGDATAGRINNGYFYANFNPRITFTTPDMDGVKVKVGLFQPEKPKDGGAIDNAVATETPRIEANVVWSGGDTSLWSSGFYQAVTVDDATIDDFTMLGIDFGGSISMSGLDLRANYSMTKGTGNGVFGGHGIAVGAKEENASQWYIEGAHDMNQSTIGASYGQGSDDSTDNDTSLAMLFYRYRATDAFTILAELQAYAADAPNTDYNAIILGSQFTF